MSPWGLCCMSCVLESLFTLSSGNKNCSKTCTSLGIVWLTALTGISLWDPKVSRTFSLHWRWNRMVLHQRLERTLLGSWVLSLYTLPMGYCALKILESLRALLFSIQQTANLCLLCPGNGLQSETWAILTHLACFPSQGSPSPVLPDVQCLKKNHFIHFSCLVSLFVLDRQAIFRAVCTWGTLYFVIHHPLDWMYHEDCFAYFVWICLLCSLLDP